MKKEYGFEACLAGKVAEHEEGNRLVTDDLPKGHLLSIEVGLEKRVNMGKDEKKVKGSKYDGDAKDAPLDRFPSGRFRVTLPTFNFGFRSHFSCIFSITNSLSGTGALRHQVSTVFLNGSSEANLELEETHRFHFIVSILTYKNH